MRVKLKSFSELTKLGYVYRITSEGVILSNKEGCWRSFPSNCFESEFEVTDEKKTISKHEYESLSDLFEIIE